MADATDSKSVIGDYVWVQVPSPVPKKKRAARQSSRALVF